MAPLVGCACIEVWRTLAREPRSRAGRERDVFLPVFALVWWIPYRARVRKLANERRAVPQWRQACFASGLIVLAIALSPPVDTLADQLLVAHMAEHLLIGDFAALLLVLGFTGPLLAPILRNRYLGRLRVFTHPVVAFVVWAVNFYVWHLPFMYQAAIRHDALHALEHATFLAFGMAMWMALLGPLPKPAWFTNGAQLGYIIAVRLTGTVLANAMIFSGTVWYPIYRSGDAHWHISADRRPDQRRRGDDGRGEHPHDLPVLLAVFEGGPPERGAPGAAGLRGRARRRARRAPGGAGGRGGPGCRAVGAGALARRQRHPYLTVSVPFIPAASWPSTVQ